MLFVDRHRIRWAGLDQLSRRAKKGSAGRALRRRGLHQGDRDSTNGDLRVAHCSNVACIAAVTATLDITGAVGAWPPISIGADGPALISYIDETNDDLKVTHCDNQVCSSATITVLDSASKVEMVATSITIGADGRPLISYDYSTGSYYHLKVMHCSGEFWAPYFRRR